MFTVEYYPVSEITSLMGKCMELEITVLSKNEPDSVKGGQVKGLKMIHILCVCGPVPQNITVVGNMP